MVKIKANVYKDTGKFYTETEIITEKQINLFETKEFIALLKENGVPFIENGFIVVNDLEDGEGFHNHLFKCNEFI